MVADEGSARILAAPPDGGDLEEVVQLKDDMAHADDAELRRDALGRRAGGGTLPAGNLTASAGEDELHQEAQLFARRVAEFLAEALREQRFEHLRIAAAPRFLGLLRKALERDVADRVEREVDRDLVQLSRRELTLRMCPRPGAAAP
jgi:protein required for attachment to host cells